MLEQVTQQQRSKGYFRSRIAEQDIGLRTEEFWIANRANHANGKREKGPIMMIRAMNHFVIFFENYLASLRRVIRDQKNTWFRRRRIEVKEILLPPVSEKFCVFCGLPVVRPREPY